MKLDLHTQAAEADIKRGICELLDKYPTRIMFTVTPPKRTKYSSKFMRAGWPDIYGVMRKTHLPERNGATGYFYLETFFIEVKKPGGALSVEQHRILERAKEWGAITCVATCLEDVRKALGL